MTISVVIPVYNGAKTIDATLASVLSQTVPPDEILVLDDGSTDDTAAIVRTYRERVTLLQQENRGVAPSRNTLCSHAGGDLIAFLDADDLWHPRYLQLQCKLFADYPNAVAFFTGHVNFFGYGIHDWGEKNIDTEFSTELIDPRGFFHRYNQATGPFASMSYCCVPKSVLAAIGPEPFRVSGVDDSHLCTLLPLWGPVVYASLPLVAYRVTNEAQSVNRLKIFGRWVNVLEILEENYEKQPDPKLLDAFRLVFASTMRQHGKLLMAAGRLPEARAEFWRSAHIARVPLSVAKSLVLLLGSYMPRALQPHWPALYRQGETPTSASGV
jgi:glycosyltransferase involved in cell wall biosynthesis